MFFKARRVTEDIMGIKISILYTLHEKYVYGNYKYNELLRYFNFKNKYS